MTFHPSDRTQMFQTTRWATVLKAKEYPSESGFKAMSELCNLYWYPTYSFARQSGLRIEDAQDFTQSFFIDLVQKNRLKNLVQTKVGIKESKFRTFLLRALKNFRTSRWRRGMAIKRGGEFCFEPYEYGDERYSSFVHPKLTEEQLFCHQLLISLMEKACKRLSEKYIGSTNERRFNALSQHLIDELTNDELSSMAIALCTSPNALKVELARLRKRFKILLRNEVAQSLAQTSAFDDRPVTSFDVEEELRALVSGG